MRQQQEELPSGADADRRVVVTILVIQASLGYVLAGLSGCLSLLADDLAVPRSSLTWLSAGYGACLVLLGVIGERVMHLGALRVLRLSGAVMAVGALLLATSSHALPAQVGALLYGAGSAGVTLACPALLTGPHAASRLAGAVAAASVSGIASPLLMGALTATVGHGRLALALPVPFLVWALLLARPTRGAPAASAAPSTAPDVPGELVPWRVGLRWSLIVAVVMAEFAFVVWGVPRLQDSGLPQHLALYAGMAFPVGMGAGRVLGAHILRSRARLAAGIALAMACGLCAAAPVGPWLVVPALVCAGLGIAPLYPFMLARLVRAPGLPLGRAAALGSIASGTAVLAAPWLLARVGERIPLRFGYLMIVPLLAAALWVVIRTGPGAPAARA